jgi:hypothetical protein
MVKKDKKTLTLIDILDNPVEELEVPGIGFVNVRCPTTKEKLDAKREANEIARGLSDVDKNIEGSRILALKILQDPKISLQEYLETNDAKISIILDTVDIWYTLKLKELNSPRKELISDFLEQMRELNQ